MRTHVHARVPTHSPVTSTFVWCRHPSHASSGKYSAAETLVLPSEHRKALANCALCRAGAADRIEAEQAQRPAVLPLISVDMRNRPSRQTPPPASPSPGLLTPHVHTFPRMLLCNVLRCSVFMPPPGMAVTATDCTQMPGIGRTFSGYSSMITSSMRVAYWNSQFRGTHKLLRVHHVFEETLLSLV
jgi:hypothetical protein